MPVIHCIRHGQSASNAGEVTQSPDSTPLTPLGREQAARVAARFARPPRLVVTSSFDRAVATSEPLCRRFPTAPTVVWPVQEFTYLAPARYHGTRQTDRAQAVADYWQRLDPVFLDGPGAETFVGFWERVEAFYRSCLTVRGPVAVFSHGQFLRGVMLRLLCGRLGPTEAMERFRAFRQAVPMPNTAVVTLVVTGRGCRMGAVGTEHLPTGMLTS